MGEAKNLINIAKHGVSFELAVRIFDGPVLSWLDQRTDYGELRGVSIGMIDQAAVLTVVHTDRSGRVRIISARPASRAERSRYDQTL